METDVAVVGGGIAGLTAANRAAQLGARVLVLEAGEDEHYACNSRIATGVLNVAHTDPHSDPALLRKAIETDTEGHATPALADALATTVGRGLQWLRAEGARMVEVPIHGTSRWMLAPPRTLKAGLDWQGRGPDVLLQTLARNLKGRGGTLLLGARARELRIEGKSCTGVVARRGEQTFEVMAHSTVLADGGFQGNRAVGRNDSSRRGRIALTQRSAGTGRGDALLMAEAGGRAADRCGELLWPSVGARLARQAGAVALPHHGHPGGRRHHGGSFRPPLPRRRLGRHRALERAGAPGRPLVATAVFDQAIWDSAGRTELVPPNPQLEAAGGTLVRADDLVALAAAIEVPADNLQDTVAGYNRAVLAGAAAELVPTRTSGRMFGESRGSSKRVRLMPIAQAAVLCDRARGGHLLHHGRDRDRCAGARHRPRRRSLAGPARGRLLHRRHRGRSARRLCGRLPQGRHARD